MSFANEFALAFDIQPLKVAFSFKMPIFQSIPVLNGLSKSIALVQKSKKKKFFESLSSFPNEIDKTDQIQIFYWLIINSLSSATSWQQRHRG